MSFRPSQRARFEFQSYIVIFFMFPLSMFPAPQLHRVAKKPIINNHVFHIQLEDSPDSLTGVRVVSAPFLPAYLSISGPLTRPND
jgi:hypothetical protein